MEGSGEKIDSLKSRMDDRRLWLLELVEQVHLTTKMFWYQTHLGAVKFEPSDMS
jgi:hypothetical protein